MIHSIQCPAKINYFLDVLGKREDGYHLIDTLFIPLSSLSDTLEISLRDQPGIKIECDHPAVPCDERNLIYKAAKLFSKLTDVEPQWNFTLTKNIPVAGGMAGGSSNASHCLMLLNEIYNFPLAHKDLQNHSVSIGADLPFFFEKSPAIAQGVGDELTPVKINTDLHFIICPFKFPISAIWAYKSRHLPFHQSKTNSQSILKHLNDCETPYIYNDLSHAIKYKFPSIESSCQNFMATDACSANVSGSGPTTFAIYANKAKRDKALTYLSKNHISLDYLSSNYH